ncbi:unnamed protein product, partial [Nesidiocoris tenuis]
HEGAGRRKSSIAIGEQHVRSEVRIAFRIRQFGESRQNYRHLLRTVDQGRFVYEQAHAMVLFHGGKYEERRQLQNHPVKSQYTKLRLLCKSLAGNNIYYLTVTDNSTDDIQEPKPKKKAVVMTARVHPGESPASWMMKGVIDFITGDSLQAKRRRGTERFERRRTATPGRPRDHSSAPLPRAPVAQKAQTEGIGRSGGSQIPTARLDLDSSQDRESSGDELQVHSAPYTAASSRQVSPKKDSKETNKSPTAHAQEPISMPPELIVTSTSQTQEITVFERLYKPSDNTKGFDNFCTLFYCYVKLLANCAFQGPWEVK